jgi:MYXO-CTERM domain-containing protein
VAGAPETDAKGVLGLGLGLLFVARRRRARGNAMI